MRHCLGKVNSNKFLVHYSHELCALNTVRDYREVHNLHAAVSYFLSVIYS